MHLKIKNSIYIFLLGMLINIPLNAQVLECQSRYKDNDMCKERYNIDSSGRKHGKYVSYLFNGDISEVITYNHGQMHGEYISHPNNIKGQYYEGKKVGCWSDRNSYTWYENEKVIATSSSNITNLSQALSIQAKVEKQKQTLEKENKYIESKMPKFVGFKYATVGDNYYPKDHLSDGPVDYRSPITPVIIGIQLDKESYINSVFNAYSIPEESLRMEWYSTVGINSSTYLEQFSFWALDGEKLYKGKIDNINKEISFQAIEDVSPGIKYIIMTESVTRAQDAITSQNLSFVKKIASHLIVSQRDNINPHNGICSKKQLELIAWNSSLSSFIKNFND